MGATDDNPEGASDLQQQDGSRRNRGQWAPGQSGNPAGRRPGESETANLRAAIKEHVPAIVSKLVERAKDGDISAARLLLERAIPPIKAIEVPAPIDLDAERSLVDQGKAVLAAAALGALTPAQASQLLTGLGTLGKLVETEDLQKRIEALEAQSGGKT